MNGFDLSVLVSPDTCILRSGPDGAFFASLSVSLVTLPSSRPCCRAAAPRHPWKDEVNCRLSRIFVVVVHFLDQPLPIGIRGTPWSVRLKRTRQSLRSSLRENTNGSVEALVASFRLFLLSGGYHLLHLPTNYFTFSCLLATSTAGNLRLASCGSSDDRTSPTKMVSPPG